MASADLQEVSKGSSLFANKFYKAVAKEEGNIFFSPLSAHTILSLVYQGAAGNTANRFQTTLGVPNEKVAAKGYNSVMNTLNNIENVTLHLANKIFVMENFPLKEKFAKSAKDSFLSEAESLNFSKSAESANNINQWVEKKTNSKIKDLISADDLDSLTRLVLVNAIYFKGNWANQFKKEATKTEKFHITSTQDMDCQMMHIKKKFNYSENESLDAKILQMQYTNENVSMVIILPNNVDGIKDLEMKLINVDLTTLTDSMRYVEVDVALPKFKIETSMDLQPVLTEMGLGIIFDQDKADFSEISPSPEKLYVSKAIQKAFIEVNEEGAEAAAATGVAMRLKSRGVTPKPLNFIADHPFVFVLQTRSNDSVHILFHGKITQPQHE